MNCENVNDVSRQSISLDPREVFEFVEGPNIKITVNKLVDKTRVTIGYQEFASPSISVLSSASVAKVGTTLPTVTFQGTIVKGSEDIASAVMTPDKGLDLTSTFNWAESNVYSAVPGIFPQFSGDPLKITVVDTDANAVEKYVGVDFRHLTYVGYSITDTLNESQIKALEEQDLLSKVLDKYSTFNYNYTVIPAYIYWVFPADYVGFTYATEGILPVPLKMDLPNVDVTDEGVTKSYRVIRTAVKARHINSSIKLQ